MHALSETDVLLCLVAFALLLLVTRAAAEVARRLGQPEVLGELLGGFLVGPSVFGAVAPAAFHGLFGRAGVGDGMSLLSWFGAILLLLIAGIEADLVILREKALPGLLAAAGAIGASLAVTAYVGTRWMGRAGESSVFLGVVYSVTAVSVVAKLLIERGALRRGYAQVMLAAGIASEVLVWPMISVLAALHEGNNVWVAGLKSAGLAVLFFVVMLTLGRRFTFWAMRRVEGRVGIANGELSLILLLVTVSGMVTAVAGLHPLLGAFVFGVLLSRAPRATLVLKERIQALTVSLFAPIFFGLAGMRVNLFELHGWRSIESILILLVVVGVLKAGFGFAGARAGKMTGWEAASIGVGLNLKGGSDVVVAIVGVELGLLSADLYTMYAVVAILTVLITPPILKWVTAKAQPDAAETERLNHEEARRRAYFADMERVLVPEVPELYPELVRGIAGWIADAKNQEREILDITELTARAEVDEAKHLETAAEVRGLAPVLQEAAEREHVVVERERTTGEPLEAVLEAAEGQQIVFAGAREVKAGVRLSFGAMQDRLVCGAACDVLLALKEQGEIARPRRILVPVNGLEHSLAAADVAAYIAKACHARLVLFHVAYARLNGMFWKEGGQRDVLQRGYGVVREAEFRLARLGVWTATRVKFSERPAEAILAELKRREYGMVVLGGIGRAKAEELALGGTIEHVMREAEVPRLLLVSRGVESGG